MTADRSKELVHEETPMHDDSNPNCACDDCLHYQADQADLGGA